MDVQMPEMNGFEATEVIRAAEPSGSHVPIIGMTGRLAKGDQERCLEAGMDGSIDKPVRKHSLDEVIARLARPDA